MWRKMSKNIVKTVAGFIDFSLLVQLLSPVVFFFAVSPAQAITTPLVSASYDTEKHEFTITAQPVISAEYTLEYSTSNGLTQGFTGKGTAKENYTFRSTGIAGTQSGESFRFEDAVDGHLSLTATLENGELYEFSNYFVIRNGTLVLESAALSQDEVAWRDNLDGSFTWQTVQLNESIIAPQNEKLTITFTQLPENPGSISIREIRLTDKQVLQLGALSNTAYDITSTMENGTFTYDLTLPNPEPTQTVNVKYSEDGSLFEDTNEVEKSQKNDTITIHGLNHFTVFVVTNNASITPLLECVIPDAQGAGFTAFFGYDNTNTSSTTVDIGPENRFTGGGSNDDNRGQPTQFIAGHSPDPFAFSVYSSNGALKWHLTDHEVSANKNSTACGAEIFEKKISGSKFHDHNGNGQRDENDEGLSGWTIKAVETTPIDTLTVNANNINGDSTDELPAGNYLLIAQGEFTNRSNPQERYDAEYGTKDGWSTHYDGLVNDSEDYGENFGDLRVNGEFQEWGPYSNDHQYYLNITLHEFSQISSAIFDGPKGSTTANPGWYGDNNGTITVEIYKVIDETITGADGNYKLTISTTEYTNVNVYELPQRGWTQTYPSNPNYHALNILEDDLNSINFGNQQIIQLADVTICKVDTENTPLNNWRIALLGNHIEEVSVPSNGSSVTSSSLDPDNYVVRATGTYSFWPSAGGGAGIADAGYSLRPQGSFNPGPGAQWIPGENLGSPWAGLLKLQIDSNDINWGPFTPDHTYYTGMNHSGGELNFRMLDSGYGDNSGSLTANIFQGWTQQTGKDGCTTFTEIPYGTYTIQEGQQENWNTVSGTGEVSINQADLRFTVMNEFIDNEGPAAPVITFPANEQYFATQPILNQWTAVTDPSGIGYYRVEYVYDDGHSFSGAPYRIVNTGTSRNHTPATWEEGGVTIRVQAFDTLGNEGAWSQPVHYYYDRTHPVSTFTSPTEGATTSTSIAISGTTTDNYSVDSVLLQYAPYNGVACETFTDLTTLDNATNNTPFNWGPYEWLPPTPGAYCLTAHGLDLAGNLEASPQIIVNYNPIDIIGGYKFHDLNQNGIWDDSEPALEDWTINVSTVTYENGIAASTEYATTTTNADGYYEFDVPVGQFEVSEELQTGWVQTAPTDGVCSFNIADPNYLEEEVEIEEQENSVRYLCNFGNYQLPPTPTPTPAPDSGNGSTSTQTNNPSAPVCSAAAPGVPEGLTVTNTTANSVTLSWTKPAGDVSHYALEFIRLSDGARYGSPQFGDSNTTSYTITNLSGQAAYRFELMAVNDCKPGERAIVTSTQITGPAINEADDGRPEGEDGQVLGTSTDEEITETGEITSGVSDNNLLGSVLGASTEDCTVPSWWWSVLAIYLVVLILIHTMFQGGTRTIAHLLSAVITAGALYKVLCMPWFWIAIVLILAVLSEALPWLMSQNSHDPFEKTFAKSGTPKSGTKRSK